MVKMNDEMRALLKKTAIWVLATADKKGIPNAVPLGCVKLMDDDRLLLVDNFMKKTVDNIAFNSHVTVSVWDDTTGYQFKGIATVETSGANFDAAVEMVKARNAKLTPKGIVLVSIDSIYFTSPGPDAGKECIQ
jgi:predicted pyridoxine 5'-phosphate oxidase superfamily flavin-nucleotide-binding protein